MSIYLVLCLIIAILLLVIAVLIEFYTIKNKKYADLCTKYENEKAVNDLYARYIKTCAEIEINKDKNLQALKDAKDEKDVYSVVSGIVNSNNNRLQDNPDQ